jgi:hypothetical protein
MPAMAGLLTISTELRLLIAENVRVLDWATSMKDELMILQATSNEDMKNLCLACKALNSLMTPFLYKDMVINVSQLESAFASTLRAAHYKRAPPPKR